MDELKKLKEHYQDLASYWNGEDAGFTYHGLHYTEDEAGEALEIAGMCERLINKIGEFKNV